VDEQGNMMDRFEFLLGDWNLDYQFPKSPVSDVAGTGTGTGSFRRVLADKYVCFDYSCSLTTGEGQAHALFGWDEKAKVYRYWWFESSGNFATATCRFINDQTLFLNWHDSLLIQTFKKDSRDQLTLRMEHPNAEGVYELVLQVLLTRR
jgi:hypothetical protein